MFFLRGLGCLFTYGYSKLDFLFLILLFYYLLVLFRVARRVQFHSVLKLDIVLLRHIKAPQVFPK